MDHGGPKSMDALTRWMGVRWEDPCTVRLTIRDELLNMAGFLSGVVAFTLVDYSMGSALWPHVGPDEGIATLNIAITYVRGARDGELVCRTALDRRSRTNAALRSEVVHADTGSVHATAVGTYAVFPRTRG